MRKSADNESTCSAAQRKRGFSLRRLLSASHILGHRSPRASMASSKKNTGKDAPESRGSNSSERANITGAVGGIGELFQTTSRTSVYTTSAKSTTGDNHSHLIECPLCLAELPPEELPELSACGHRSCYNCLQQYLRIEISESRVIIACPECSEPMHPNEIRTILNDPAQYEKYEDFMVRRVLAVDPDTRWCPAPDCSFAVIATGCASCPKIKCERPGCNAYFCYHCKAEWHPNQTCDAARAQRSPNVRSSSVSFSQESQHRDDIKPCPRCQVLIVKMDDGSCNHMMCAVCGAEFCWLCMKEISDLHYLSPSGCTFWGKKPWSRKKKILWQLGTLVGAPVGIALLAGIAVPAMIIGIPVWVGRKLYTRYRIANKHKRNAAIVGGAVASMLISPVLAGLAVGIGVPILLFYVYGVVPVSLCRSGGCGVSTTATGVKFEFDDENDLSQISQTKNMDNASMDAASHRGVNPSIGEASLSMVSGGSQVIRLGHEADRESASNVAMVSASLTGSIGSAAACQRLEVQADVSSTQRFSMSSETASASLSDDVKSVCVSMAEDGASTRALAGSVLNYCKANGNDSCSCITGSEDCSSERVRFDDNVSFIACNSPYTDKVSIGSSCSRSRSRSIEKSTKPPMGLTEINNEELNNDSISIDISGNNLLESHGDGLDLEDKPKKMSASEILRSVFFRLTPVEIQKLDASPKRSDSKTNLQSNSTNTVTITQENKSNIQPFNNSHTTSIYNKNSNIGKSIYVENSSL